ncbi:hypothetical protein BURPS305_5594 [Burkholderia pseudomallei 305]|nr:hypothetical protein BURPS305_5594 [Burkholderia pseudomallei 305]
MVAEPTMTRRWIFSPRNRQTAKTAKTESLDRIFRQPIDSQARSAERRRTRRSALTDSKSTHRKFRVWKPNDR